MKRMRSSDDVSPLSEILRGVPRSTRKLREFSDRYAHWIVHPDVAVAPPYDIDTQDEYGDIASAIHPPTRAFY